MDILDDIEVFKKYDKSDMKGLIDAFPEQLRDAREIAEEAELMLKEGDYKGIASIGMGGSMVGGAIMSRLMERWSEVPFLAFNGYHIPEYVDEDWLVFAISYSGNTLETLSSLKEVFQTGCEVVAITSGGVLGEIAEKRDLTIVEIPGGRPPRASLGYLLIPIGVVLERLGLYEGFGGEVENAVDRMSGLSEIYCFETVLENNPAKKLAVKLAAWLPVIYGADGVLDICAERWAGQLQENSKLLAFYLSFPELCHNQSIGWVDRSGVAEDIVILPLIGEWEEEAISEQREALLEIAQQSGARVNRIEVSGDGGLVSILECLYFADYTSLYLAMLNSADPTAIGSIDLIKERVEGFKERVVKVL